MTDEPDKGRGGTPIWLRLLLAGSLAINFLILGIVIGAVSNGRGGERDGGDDRLRAARDLGPAPLVMALDREDRMALARKMREQSERRPFAARRELRQRFEALLSALRADPFVPADLEAVLVGQVETVKDRQDLGRQILVEHIGSLSPEDRQRYADRIENSVRRAGRP